MKTYTVIAIYADNYQRFADTVDAESPEAAEAMVLAQAEADGTELIIAGVVAGEADLVA